MFSRCLAKSVFDQEPLKRGSNNIRKRDRRTFFPKSEMKAHLPKLRGERKEHFSKSLREQD